ncbi:MAG: transporter [Planctomycetes bacterium]|nr:transporter [Planctomycetota bacterium]
MTDRPDFTEASSTVGRGVTQIEFGYTYTYNADDGTSERGQSIGEPLLRYGIFADWLELRIGLLPVEERITAGGRTNSTAGTEDLYLGLKIGLTPQEGILPEMALIPQMTVPTGSNAFTNDEALPGVNWIYSWEINDVLSTAGSTQINRRVDGMTRNSYSEIAQSWTVAVSLTDNMGAYTEWFALIPHSADTDLTQHFFNGGFTYLISDDIQFDIRAGVGLNDAAADYFLGTGLSVRFK